VLAPQPRWRNRRVVAAAGVLLLVLVGGSVALALMPARTGGQDTGSGPVVSDTAPPEPTASTTPGPPPPAASVPFPSVGQAIPVGETPGYAVATPDGRQLYVANREARTLTVVDVELEQTIGRIPVSVGPVQFVAFAPDGQTAYLSLYDKGSEAGAFGVLDIRTREVVTTVPLDGEPWSPAVTRDGSRIYLPLVGPNTVAVIDTGTYEIRTQIPVRPLPHSIEFTPPTAHAATSPTTPPTSSRSSTPRRTPCYGRCRSTRARTAWR